MRKILSCFILGSTSDEFPIVIADAIPIDNSNIPIGEFTVGLLKKHIWKEMTNDFVGGGSSSIRPKDLNLWKVEIPICKESKKILDENPEINYIKQVFNAKKLAPGNMF